MILSASFQPQSVCVNIQGQSVGAIVPESERVPVPGEKGDPGFSPIVAVEDIPGGHEVTITDEQGDHSFDVMDGEQGIPGKDGSDGKNGITPEIFTAAETLKPGSPAYAHTSGTVEQPLITFGIPEGQPGKNGSDGKNGEDGKDGTDGVSPGVTVAAITGGHSVTITDADHPGGQTFNVMDGEQGAPGTTDYNDLQNKPTIPSTAADVGALPDSTKYALSPSVGGNAICANGLPYGVVDGTSTATAFTATVPGVTSLYDGLCILLKNNVIASKADCTLNINGLGAKRIHYSTALNTQITTVYSATMTALFYYDSARNSGAGAWVFYYGYDSNTNTIGYQVRTNALSLPMKSIVYRYRLLFTSADGLGYVPANNSTSTNGTAARTPCQNPIDPFGRIVYYGTTASVAAGSRPSASYQWQQYSGITIGYSFQKSTNYVLAEWKPIYLCCNPQTDGSAIIDSTTPFTQALPSSNDGKIYVFLGVATSTTAFELTLEHPVYYHNGTGIRKWTGGA